MAKEIHMKLKTTFTGNRTLEREITKRVSIETQRSARSGKTKNEFPKCLQQESNHKHDGSCSVNPKLEPERLVLFTSGG